MTEILLLILGLVVSPVIAWAAYWLSPWGRQERAHMRSLDEQAAEIERILAHGQMPAQFHVLTRDGLKYIEPKGDRQ